MTNDIQFSTDLRAFADAVDLDLRTVQRKVALDLFAKVTRRSPVDTGRFRSAWQVVDALLDVTVPPEGQASYPPQGAVRSTFTETYGVVIVINPLPYGPRLEFDGHSRQAPAGMVRIALAEIDAELQSVTGEP